MDGSPLRIDPMRIEDIAALIMGRNVKLAKAILTGKRSGIKIVHVVTRDGQPMIGTKDLRQDRINVDTEKGLIVRVRSIG